MQRDKSLDWMRAVLTILVVIGHCTFFTINTKFGGIDYQGILQDNGLSGGAVYVALNEVKAIIYKFHMPAFIALSGILYGRKYRSGKIRSLNSLATNKFKRLIVPFILCWLLWNIPLKLISGYYLPIKNNIWMMLAQMLNPYQVHLWYLEALFFIFIIHYIICKYISNTYVRIAICIMCYIGGVLIRYKYGAPLGNPLLYIIWFEVGFDCINEKSDKLPIGFEIILFGICYILTLRIQYSWIAIDLPLGYLGSDILYKLAIYRTSYAKSNELLKVIARYSFGIYLLSDPINYVVLFVWVQVFGITALSSNIMNITLFLIRVSITLVIPILLIIAYEKYIKSILSADN